MKKILPHLEYILLLPLAIISILSGLNKNFILILVGVGFFVEGICYIFLATNKAKARKFAGILSFINGAISIVILLFFAITMLPEVAPLYYLIYVVIYGIFKIFTFFYYLHFKDDLNFIIYKEFSIVVIMLLINLIACILLYNFDQNETLDYMIDVLVKVFVDNYTGYDTLKFYLLIIKIALNFFTSLFVAYYSTSSLILLLKNEKLTIKNKIKSIIDFFDKYNLAFILGEIFTTIILISYFIKINDNNNNEALASFYLFILFMRTFIFIFNKVIVNKYKDDEYKIYHKQFLLLIISSSIFIILSSAFISVLSAITAINNNPFAFPIWWLLLIILPFSGYGFVNAVLSYRRAKMDDNPYLLAYSNLSFISSMYMLFGAVIFVLAKVQKDFVAIVVFILIAIIFTSQLVISIKSLIIGIQGIKGKRKKPEDFIENNDDI